MDDKVQKSDLGLRVISGVAMGVIALTALYLGGNAFWLLLAIGAVAMQHEWAALVERSKNRKLAMLALFVPISIMSPLAAGPSFLALGLIVAAFLFVCAVERGAALASGIFYAGLPVLGLLYLRASEDGLILAFWAMAIVWATDIGAYFAGRAIGGPKLAPSISPNKTWAGLVGGMAAALVTGLLFHIYAGLPAVLAFASPILAALAQCGDLLESGMKRKAGLKDSGNLIPGHGGILDRVDGLVPVAIVAAMIVAALRFI
ncbi:phosphatidate cytidylyltransferase [Sphingorhabdus sp. Alg239-R122]|uniref:phosphatidate cytidylyltransferase n=1 Tax=Sphingorhabdus sp. Alg239-R122 TaxID=2305989 RepID=UPI0013DCC643|nr:phosphatidate cytidylyltransferase [Sphingorhabdus sp. Alg239-R122]